MDWNQKPKPDPVHDQMNNPTAALPFLVRRQRVSRKFPKDN